MAVSDALKSFRKGDYGDDKGKEEKPSSRVINLTDDEAKELMPYQEKFGPGEEMVIEATGKLEDGHFHVMSVKYAQGGGPESDEDMKKVAGLDNAYPPGMPS
jgi:hypothetical protein